MPTANCKRCQKGESLVKTSLLRLSPEDIQNITNEQRKFKSSGFLHKGLTLSVKPDRFRLPFCTKSAVSVILENKNSCAISFTIDTNSPLTLTIEPQAGCIAPRDKAHIVVGRPKKIPVTRRSEHLIFKIKYCSQCNHGRKEMHVPHSQPDAMNNHFHKINITPDGDGEPKPIKHKYGTHDDVSDHQYIQEQSDRCPSLKPEVLSMNEDSSDRIYIIKNGHTGAVYGDNDSYQDEIGKEAIQKKAHHHPIDSFEDGVHSHSLNEEISDDITSTNTKKKLQDHRDSYYIHKLRPKHELFLDDDHASAHFNGGKSKLASKARKSLSIKPHEHLQEEKPSNGGTAFDAPHDSEYTAKGPFLREQVSDLSDGLKSKIGPMAPKSLPNKHQGHLQEERASTGGTAFDGSHDSEYIEKHRRIRSEEFNGKAPCRCEHCIPPRKKFDKNIHGTRKRHFIQNGDSESKWPKKIMPSPIHEQIDEAYESPANDGVIKSITRRMTWPLNALTNLFKSNDNIDFTAETISTSEEEECNCSRCSKRGNYSRHFTGNKGKIYNKKMRLEKRKKRVSKVDLRPRSWFPYVLILLLTIAVLVLLVICQKMPNFPFLRKEASFWEKYIHSSIH